jgi:hypothetical protein
LHFEGKKIKWTRFSKTWAQNASRFRRRWFSALIMLIGRRISCNVLWMRWPAKKRH